jgi:hypothetical protein
MLGIEQTQNASVRPSQRMVNYSILFVIDPFQGARLQCERTKPGESVPVIVQSRRKITMQLLEHR